MKKKTETCAVSGEMNVAYLLFVAGKYYKIEMWFFNEIFTGKADLNVLSHHLITEIPYE